MNIVHQYLFKYLYRKIRYKINTSWDGKKITHPPVTLTLKAKADCLHLHIEAPFFNDPPPNVPAGRALWKLWEYEGMYILQ